MGNKAKSTLSTYTLQEKQRSMIEALEYQSKELLHK